MIEHWQNAIALAPCAEDAATQLIDNRNVMYSLSRAVVKLNAGEFEFFILIPDGKGSGYSGTDMNGRKVNRSYRHLAMGFHAGIRFQFT